MLVLTTDSFTDNPLSGHCMGHAVIWTNRKEYMTLCRKGITLAQKWFNRNIFWRRNVFVDGVCMGKIGWGARQYLERYRSDPHVDIRLIEQQLRHSMEYWYPWVLLWCVTDNMHVIPELAKLVIAYAQEA